MSMPQTKSPKAKYLDAVSKLATKEKQYRAAPNKETKTAIKLSEDIKTLKATIKDLKPFKDVLNLSETTRTWIKGIAKRNFYGYKVEIGSKYFDKGHAVEDTSIELLNIVEFTGYEKNTERRTATHPDGFAWLTGECDIYTPEGEIRDIKSSWDIETFPAFKEDAEKKLKDSGYNWQMRGYMILWNAPRATVDFCLVDTPPELLSDYDNWELHEVDHIDPVKRITSVSIERDETIEDEILERYKWANHFYHECMNELKSK